MSQYEVINGPITLPVGVIVHLTAVQAALREHALKKQGNGVFEVILPIQFKNGELLGFDEVPDKALLAAFFPADKIREIQAERLQQPKQQERPPKKAKET